MNCVNHPETVATAYCRTCGKALCANCTRTVRGVIYCEECLAARVEGVAPAVPAPPQGWAQPTSGGPNPAVAGILAFVLPFGTGVMYCGEFTRALIHAGVFFGLIAAESTIRGGGEVVFGLGIAFWLVFMIVDSVRVARAKQLGQPIPDIFGLGLSHPAEPVVPGGAMPADAALAPAPGKRMPIGPIILIGIGVLFMLNTLDVWYFDWGHVWPWFVIAVGAWMFYNRYQRPGCHCVRCMATCLMGPALVVTTGVLGLLDEYTRWYWGRSWPLYLIVIGGIKMLQLSGPTEGHIEPPAPPSAPAADSAAQSQVSHG